MSHLVPAAEQLIAEVYQARKDAKSKTIGLVDGIDVYRQISFDAATTRWLLPILEAADDPRIESIETDKNKTVITFVPDVRADFKDSFGVAEADEILGDG